MTQAYVTFIAKAKILAAEHGVDWNLEVDAGGEIPKSQRWDLTKLSGKASRSGKLWLSNLRVVSAGGRSAALPETMSHEWQEFTKAVTIEEICVSLKTAGGAYNSAQSVRILAGIAQETPPWELTPDMITQAYDVALSIGESGKAAVNLEVFVRKNLDNQMLARIPALALHCRPSVVGADHAVQSYRENSNSHRALSTVRNKIEERKSAEKLPERKAFWEIVRIIFTETPRTLSDAIKFAAVKILIVTGFRVGEMVRLPADWERWKEYVDTDGQSAGQLGGISRSLRIRHFAEKQETLKKLRKTVLYENLQDVPKIFEEIVLETLQEVKRLTATYRRRLEDQIRTGRLFPEYEADDLIPAYEAFVRYTGNAKFSSAQLPAKLVEKYRETLDDSILVEIRKAQEQASGRFDPARVHWCHPNMSGVPTRRRDGSVYDTQSENRNWRDVYIRIGDLEKHMADRFSDRKPPAEPASLADGTNIYAYDLLFLVPLRGMIEGKGGLLDPTMHFEVGTLTEQQINVFLDGKENTSIFKRYGRTDEDRAHVINSHAFRHLQNAELFRLGVADTIISKRFNRTSVAQSYEYDHRSLAEELDTIDIPEAASLVMGDNARQVYQMILANKIGGPIVDEFRQVQSVMGDEAAFEFLAAEADGLHVTPYGFCLSSFTVDPCPKNLECFNGCLHHSRTNLPAEEKRLQRLER